MAQDKRRHRPKNAAEQQKNNVTKFRRQRLPNLNFGMIIFLLMFIYVVVMIFLSFRTKRLTSYEVQTGSLATQNSYRGIALRSETLYPAGAAGYLNFYAREDAKVAKGELIYSVDKSGTFSELIARNEENKELLSDEDLLELKTEVENYSDNYSDHDFSSVYDFKYSVEGTATKLINSNAMKSISSLSGNALLNDSVSLGYSSNSGIVVYSYDGMEKLTPDTVSADSFDRENYKKHQSDHKAYRSLYVSVIYSEISLRGKLLCHRLPFKHLIASHTTTLSVRHTHSLKHYIDFSSNCQYNVII